MTNADDIRRYFEKSTLSTNAERHEAIFEQIQRAHDQSKNTAPALSRLNSRRTIMKSPITKLAAAGVVIAVALIVASQFGGSATGVAWGEVIARLEASRGVVFRRTMTSSNQSGDDGYRMIYSCPTHSRTDHHKGGQIVSSLYCDYNTKTLVSIQHERKSYLDHQLGEQAVRDHQTEVAPKAWVQKFLSCKYRKLGQKTIEGILCEGLETTDPTFGDADSPVDSLMLRLWVSVETGYPVLCEGNIVFEADKGVRIEAVLDQFQWDVELDASEFEPRIPADYEDMRTQ